VACIESGVKLKMLPKKEFLTQVCFHLLVWSIQTLSIVLFDTGQLEAILLLRFFIHLFFVVVVVVEEIEKSHTIITF
jgi:hypothetical protein